MFGETFGVHHLGTQIGGNLAANLQGSGNITDELCYDLHRMPLSRFVLGQRL